MAVYRILTEPHPFLHTICKPVPSVTPAILRLLGNLWDTLYAVGGIGLAAPQIGVSKRVIICDVGQRSVELINPEIIYAEGEELARDACLSVPGIQGETWRHRRVLVRGWDRTGSVVEHDATGLFSHCLQHEIDHVNGILFTQKAERLYRL